MMLPVIFKFIYIYFLITQEYILIEIKQMQNGTKKTTLIPWSHYSEEMSYLT